MSEGSRASLQAAIEGLDVPDQAFCKKLAEWLGSLDLSDADAVPPVPRFDARELTTATEQRRRPVHDLALVHHAQLQQLRPAASVPSSKRAKYDQQRRGSDEVRSQRAANDLRSRATEKQLPHITGEYFMELLSTASTFDRRQWNTDRHVQLWQRALQCKHPHSWRFGCSLHDATSTVDACVLTGNWPRPSIGVNHFAWIVKQRFHGAMLRRYLASGLVIELAIGDFDTYVELDRGVCYTFMWDMADSHPRNLSRSPRYPTDFIHTDDISLWLPRGGILQTYVNGEMVFQDAFSALWQGCEQNNESWSQRWFRPPFAWPSDSSSEGEDETPEEDTAGCWRLKVDR